MKGIKYVITGQYGVDLDVYGHKFDVSIWHDTQSREECLNEFYDDFEDQEHVICSPNGSHKKVEFNGFMIERLFNEIWNDLTK